jgi:hypothetical protein
MQLGRALFDGAARDVFEYFLITDEYRFALMSETRE